MLDTGFALLHRPRLTVTIVLLFALLCLAVGDVAAWGSLSPNGSTLVSGP